jgi:nucleotide-binding universal stress UspA family protein
MLKRIVIATDGAPQSQRAVRLGSAIAGRFDAEVVLVHALVTEPSEQEATAMGQVAHELGPQAFAPMHMDDLVRTIQARAESSPTAEDQEALDTFGRSLLEHAAGVAREEGAEVAATELLHGDAGRAIAEAVEARDADLVVLGTRGLGGIKSQLLGSVSRHVTTHVDANCLTVQ